MATTIFQAIVEFSADRDNIFKTFEEAKEAYDVFRKREDRRLSQKKDKLLEFMESYQPKVKWYLRQTKDIGYYSDIYQHNHYKLSDVMKFLESHRYMVDGGIFSSRNIAGDEMRTVYEKEGVTIDYAPYYGYVEIFGLREGDFDKVCERFT